MPLIIISNEGGQHVAEFTLGDRPIVIGRSRTADLRLDHKSISSQHCRVQMTPDGGIEVIDLDSTNGVRLDGKAAPRVDLRPGLRTQIGAFTLEIAATEGGAARAMPMDGQAGKPALPGQGVTSPSVAQAGAPALPDAVTPPGSVAQALQPVPSPVASPAKPSLRPVLAAALIAASLLVAIVSLPQLGAAYDRVAAHLRGETTTAPAAAPDSANTLPPGEAPIQIAQMPSAEPLPDAGPGGEWVDPLAGLDPVDLPPVAAVSPPESARAAGPEPERPSEPIPTPPSTGVAAGAPPTAEPLVGGSDESGPPPAPASVVDPEFDSAAIRDSHELLTRRAVGKTQPVALRGGEVMEGIVLEITDTHVRCSISLGGGSAEMPIPIETVEKIGAKPVLADLPLLRDRKRSSLRTNDAAGLYSLARWCGTYGLPKSRLELLDAVLVLDPDHAFARADLGYVSYAGGWRRVEELRAEGLGCWNGRWFTADELRRRGLVEYAGEWMTADEANARQGLVKVAGQWVTKGEAEKLRQGLVNYCGLWIPARVAFAIMKDSYYEQVLRRARPMPAADIEKNQERIFALHLQKAEEDEGSPLTSGQRREELQRLSAIVRRAREMPESDFALNARLLAQEMAYRTRAERLGYDRYTNELTTARRVELESEIAAVNLINAVRLEEHQAGHAYLIALEADRLRQEVESRAAKLNERAAKALAALREALIGGVNVGFEVSPKIEGPAAGSDHQITVLREDYLKGLARLEVKLRRVLTAEQVARAVQFQPTVDAVSSKDLDRKADQAKKNPPGGT
ncbi:MAG: FHA domain-containing protein [Planctomycetes bacterium]|nr:FHA domain-containing protein [Planctomycetota bacterium]